MFAASHLAQACASNPVGRSFELESSTLHSLSKVLSSGQSERFSVEISGDHRLSDFEFIFPDQYETVPVLNNTDVNVAEYRSTLSALPVDESLSFLGFVPAHGHIRRFELGTNGRTPLQPYGFNFDINRRLAPTNPTTLADLILTIELSKTLEKLPKTSGEFVCAVEHGPACPSPWGTALHVNDVVSCCPYFFPAFGNMSTVRQGFEKGTFFNSPVKDTDTVVLYKLRAAEGVTTAVPLIVDFSVGGPEGCGNRSDIKNGKPVLFAENSCFRVDGIAAAEQIEKANQSGNRTSGAPRRRVGVLLTQIPWQDGNLKNILNGSDLVSC